PCGRVRTIGRNEDDALEVDVCRGGRAMRREDLVQDAEAVGSHQERDVRIERAHEVGVDLGVRERGEEAAWELDEKNVRVGLRGVNQRNEDGETNGGIRLPSRQMGGE